MNFFRVKSANAWTTLVSPRHASSVDHHVIPQSDNYLIPHGKIICIRLPTVSHMSRLDSTDSFYFTHHHGKFFTQYKITDSRSSSPTQWQSQSRIICLRCRQPCSSGKRQRVWWRKLMGRCVGCSQGRRLWYRTHSPWRPQCFCIAAPIEWKFTSA